MMYTSKRDATYTIIYSLITLLLIGIILINFFDKDFTWSSWLLMVLVFGLIIMFSLIGFFFIKVKICGEKLVVNVIFDIFKIEISKFTKVRIGETMWSGFHKYGTSTKGLIIFSKDRNDLYVTPENQDEFLEQLLKINSQILIEDVRNS